LPQAELKNKCGWGDSPDGWVNSLPINQYARILAGRFDAGWAFDCGVRSGRRYGVQIASGLIEINGEITRVGDGLAIKAETAFSLRSVTDSEILVFDLP